MCPCHLKTSLLKITYPSFLGWQDILALVKSWVLLEEKNSKFILSYLDTWPTKTWSIPKEKVLQQVFFILRRPIRFHCIIIKTRSCKLWSSSQTWLSTYHVKNKKKERLFIWNKGSSWSSKRRNKMAHFQPQCLEFPRKFVSQFMHVDTNVTHSCATITIVLHFTLSGISFCPI